MKTAAFVMSALLVLTGCASQEPVKVVDTVCDSASCVGQLAQLREKSRADLDACNTARLAAQAQAEKGLSEKGAELARCQVDLTALQQKAKADGVAMDAMRQELQKHAQAAADADKQLQRMKDLEDRLRQRLQNEIGAKDVEIERLLSQLSVRVLDRILFKTGSAEILPQGRKVLDSVATALADGNETIRIEGHTDIVPIGPVLKEKYFSNWELSGARASSVARFFQHKHGIEPTRMEAVGFSKYRPIAPNDSEENRQRNRRVEIVLTPWKPVTGASAL